MAKKPKMEIAPNEALETTIKSIQAKFGEGAIMKLGDKPRVDIAAISTGSFGLDAALGIGGLHRGRIIEIFGPESSGKTTLALHAVAEAQKAGGIAAFVDAEHALDPVYSGNLGVNTAELLVSQPDTGEQALEITESLVRSGKIDIVVIDSVAALTPRDEIEGEMGAQHVGKQARLMSQALRKLTAIVAKSKTTVIFINQIRMQIGVMFGCLNYTSRITLADGTQEKVGKIVNQKIKAEVLAYDWKRDKIIPAKITGWHKNGNADTFLHITIYNPSGNGKSQLSCTSNHPLLTPVGWRRAGELRVGDRVLIGSTQRLSDFQMQIINGSLLGDGNLSPRPHHKNSLGIRFRLGHGLKQKGYLLWKATLFKNISHTIYEDKKSIKFDLTPLPELHAVHTSMYKEGYKFLSPEFLAHLTPLSLAIWYQDDGGLAIRNKERDRGRITICIQAIHPKSRRALQNVLETKYDIQTRLGSVRGKAILYFNQHNSEKFMNLVKRYVHPSMGYKLLPRYKDRYMVIPQYAEAQRRLISVPILDIHEKPRTRSMVRFDISVRGHHNFLADNILVHNSPETTPGGKALKFYTSVRLDVRRIAQIKKGEEVVGSRVRVKVVKNKVAAPFRLAEFDLMYNEGISREGELIAMGEKIGLIAKSGTAYAFGDTKLGRGYDATRQMLKEDKKLSGEIYKAIQAKMKEPVVV